MIYIMIYKSGILNAAQEGTWFSLKSGFSNFILLTIHGVFIVSLLLTIVSFINVPY